MSIATYKEGFQLSSEKGLVEDLFKKIQGGGYLGIGQVSPIEGDELIHIDGPVELVFAGDGKPLYEGDKSKAFRLLAQSLSEKLSTQDPLDATALCLKEFQGGYAFIALTERQEMICARDSLGVKPLEVGSVGFDLGIVASETAALDVVGAQHSGSIRPGEVVAFDPLSVRRKSTDVKRRAFCSFEYVYLARPDSILNEVAVYEVRENIGKRLAEESPAEGEVVIGVPETAIPFALAYSEACNIPTKVGFTRTGRHVRSAIKPTQFERLVGVQLKLNPVKYVVDGKDVILIDDSVVRGNTLKNTVLNLKRKGAKKVHVRIGSPALTSPCPFGVEVPPPDELIGRALTQEEIAEIIGADSFAYLSVDGLVKAIGLPKDRLCLGCFTGRYPEDVETV